MEEWIVQYVGDAQELFQNYSASYEVLLGGYAIVKARKEDMACLKNRDGVLYVEGPMVMECEQLEKAVGEQNAICLAGAGTETGKGVIMAYLDSGIDYRHPEFFDEMGNTRIIGIYDLAGEVLREYTREQIEEALLLPAVEGDKLVPVTDISGHGTHVAAIGSGRSGVAPGSEILMVKIAGGIRDETSNISLLRGIDYSVKVAMRLRRPMVLNISFGNNYGAHDGSSMVEQYLDEVLNFGKLCIVVGAGNEGDKDGHAHAVLADEKAMEIPFAIGPFQPPFFLQLWKRFEDQMEITLLSPSGEQFSLLEKDKNQMFQLGKETISISSFEPTPHVRRQAFLISWDSEGEYQAAGIWKLVLKRMENRRMEVDLWMPAKGQLNKQTGFLTPSPSNTITIPGTARRVITVGAYDTRYERVAAFSGRGYPSFSIEVKPDLVAPGVDVVSASNGGGYVARSGTSMAVPFVSGAAALLMEWGVVKGRDPFLYADRLKAFLLRGAEKLPGDTDYPNPISGWGKLCIRKSFS